jgi:isopenicillin N synthase-like dioxygenase|tara:strand:+ start:2083 stop:3120 length:1038 start_codon:yes stop_codon:yes gene_type:complete
MTQHVTRSLSQWREAAMINADALRSGGEIGDFELARLRHAVAKWGFFELHGHGVEQRHVQALFAAQRAFFALPDAQKLSLRRTAINARGYNPGELTKNALDAKEILDFGHKPDPKAEDNAPVNVVADGWNQMPEDAAIREPLWDWFCLCEPLAIEVYGWLLQAMGARADRAPLTEGHASFLRLNAYSDAHRLIQRQPNSQAEGVDSAAPLGIHPHTDSGLLTLLVQDGHHALQVLHEGQWCLIQPQANTFIVNTGDMLQVMSNDYFVAPEHRVLGSVGDQYRLSAAYFFNPPYEQVIEALTPMRGYKNNEGPRYRGFTWEEFRSRRGAGDYADLGEEVQISQYRI